jgi:hypothetical protein
MILVTWGRQSRAPFPLSWAYASAMHPPPCQGWPRECGATASCLNTPRSRYIGHATWAHSYTAASPAPFSPDRNTTLNTFHLRCIWRILNIKWQEKVPNTDALERSGIPSVKLVHYPQAQTHEWRPNPQGLALRWFGTWNIPVMKAATSLQGHLQEEPEHLRGSDVRTIVMEISSAWWTHQAWWKICAAVHSREAKKKLKTRRIILDGTATEYICTHCGRNCHSRFSLTSHTRQSTRAQTS